MEMILKRLRMRLLKPLFVVLLSSLVCFAKAQTAMPDACRPLEGFPFVFCSDSVDQNLLLTDSFFDQYSTSVPFAVNSYALAANNPFLVKYREKVLPYLREHNLELKKMFIRGASSPEGSHEANAFLAKSRASKLVDEMKAVDSLNYLLVVDAVAEDYQRLINLLHRKGDSGYEIVKSLYEQYKHDPYTLKAKLMSRNAFWNRLVKDYFPYLRDARVILFCAPHQDIVTNVVVAQQVDSLVQDTIPLPVPILSESTATMDAVVHQPPAEYRREWMSVKSNLLFYGAYIPDYDGFCPIPNVAIEFYPLRGHFTYGASLDCPWWQHYDQHHYFQIRNYQVHTRFYLRSGSIKKRQAGMGAAFKGLYFSAYAHAGLYNVCMDANHGYEGEGFGGGLGLGYVIGLGKRQHWRLELGVQGGYFYTRYDPYQWLCPVQPELDPQLYYYKWYGNADDFVRRQHRYTWLGPTRAEITLSYDLLYRRIHKKGISFRSKEKRQNNKKQKK